MSALHTPARPALSPWQRTIRSLGGLRISRSSLYRAIIVIALLAFELFNFSTTEFALAEMLGGANFAGLRWATILTLAFCGIDFAGIAGLLTATHSQLRTMQSRYMIGAWFLAGSMNAVLTWWSVSLALLSSASLGNEILGRGTLLKAVPIFVAVLVWLMRVLIIGTFTLGDRPGQPSGSPAAARQASPPSAARRERRPSPAAPSARPVPSISNQPGMAHNRVPRRAAQRDVN